MDKLSCKVRALGVLLVGALVFFSSPFFISTARANQDLQNNPGDCLSCHGDPTSAKTLPNGESLPLYVNPDTLAHSVHAPLGVDCQSCHPEIQVYPHPEQNFNSLRDVSLATVKTCQKCHTAIYEKTTDSMHHQAAQAGNQDAPVCTDCHGAHDVQPPEQPRTRVSETCGKCHTEIYTTYTQSIHGSALSEDNPDVPVCTDCHGVHNIQDPRTQQFRLASPELCAGCHANETLMAKYNLPANVYDLYKLSWHGVDVSVYKARWPTIWHDSAVCTDCHGTHNIRTAKDPLSTVSSANLLSTCQKCHPSAGANWTGAWTGHHEIGPKSTPLLYSVKVFYSYFVPVVLGLSILYVILQILRRNIERVKRSLS